MPRVEVWVMDLPTRPTYTPQGGTKVDRARSLFVGLLPGDEAACYTADEVVRRALPNKEDYDLRVNHRRLLDSLGRKHGLNEGGNPGPDNTDADGELLPGKRTGKQPCRWKRATWLKETVTDEAYEWLRELNQEIAGTVESCTLLYPGRRVRVFIDLDTFVLSVEPGEAITEDLGEFWDITNPAALQAARPSWPATPYLTPSQYKAAVDELAAIRRRQYMEWKTRVIEEAAAHQAALNRQYADWQTQVAEDEEKTARDKAAEAARRRAAPGQSVKSRRRPHLRCDPRVIGGLVAAVLIMAFLWPRETPPPFRPVAPMFPAADAQAEAFTEELAVIEEDDYLRRGQGEPVLAFCPPLADDDVFTTWKATAQPAELLASNPPPLFIAASTRLPHRLAVDRP